MIVTMRSSSSEVISPALHTYLIQRNPKEVCFRAARWLKDRDHPPFVQIDISLLAYQIRVPTSYTLYFRQGVHDLLLAIDIGIEETKDELEV